MPDLSGKVGLVTGAASGIGAATARLLVAAGAAVAICDIDGEGASRVAGEIADAGGRATAYSCDIASSTDLEAAVSGTVGEWGRLDAVAACAGIARHGSVTEFSEDDWNLVLDTNLKGLFFTAKHAVPALAASGGGSIVTLSSVNATNSARLIPAYAASKGGIASMTRTLALDHAAEGIRVNCVLPGSVDTDLLRGAARRRSPDDPQAAINEWGRKHPLGRVLTPEEVGNAIVFLLSDEASGITGAMLNVDGGLTAQLAL